MFTFYSESSCYTEEDDDEVLTRDFAQKEYKTFCTFIKKVRPIELYNEMFFSYEKAKKYAAKNSIWFMIFELEFSEEEIESMINYRGTSNGFTVVLITKVHEPIFTEDL